MLSSSAVSAQSPPDIKSCKEAPPTTIDQHATLRSSDGTCLFYRYWLATEQKPGNPVVLVLHGIGYHSGPYKLIADAWGSHGIDVYALDARAHGLSGGRRQFIGTREQVAQDVAAMIQEIQKRHPSAKIYLLGESMGGAYALNYAREHSHQFAGLILIAPALGVTPGQFFRISNLCLLPDYLFWQRAPAVSLVDKRLEQSSRDARFIAERRADPLAYQKVSFGYLKDAARLVDDWRTQIPANVRIPTLILWGEKDPIISLKDCRELARVLPSAEHQAYPDVPHTLLWDPRTKEILDFTLEWMNKH